MQLPGGGRCAFPLHSDTCDVYQQYATLITIMSPRPSDLMDTRRSSKVPFSGHVCFTHMKHPPRMPRRNRYPSRRKGHSMPETQKITLLSKCALPDHETRYHTLLRPLNSYVQASSRLTRHFHSNRLEHDHQFPLLPGLRRPLRPSPHLVHSLIIRLRSTIHPLWLRPMRICAHTQPLS